MIEEKISKSEQKRRFKRVEEAAVELSQLSTSEIKALPVSESIKDEILATRSVKTGAKKRQIKYLAKVVREEEAVDEVLDFLAERKGSKLKANNLFHEAERLRDSVVNEALAYRQEAQQMRESLAMDWPGEELRAVLSRLDINENELRSSLYQYTLTRAQNHFREVFRMIMAALEKEARANR